MAIDPLQQFNDDRTRAREAGDPMAHVCTVANVDADNRAQLRTLVLRDVEGALAIFINATSPKWQALTSGCAVQTYWPSVNLQYRMDAEVTPLDPAVVASSWQLRPDAPKRMDWFYEHQAPQSSAIASRQELLDRLQQLTLPEPLVAPQGARGLLLHITRMERLDLNQDNGVHDRVCYVRNGSDWQHNTLVP